MEDKPIYPDPARGKSLEDQYSADLVQTGRSKGMTLREHYAGKFYAERCMQIGTMIHEILPDGGVKAKGVLYTREMCAKESLLDADALVAELNKES